MKTLILILADGKERRVQVPEDATFTFGPAIPFERKAGGYTHVSEYAVRIYADDKAKKVIGVFTGIREVRYADLRVEDLVIREAGKAIWKSDAQGFHAEQTVKRTRKLLNTVRLDEDDE